MFLKAGALSLVLLLASRIFGLARESVQAAAFGASGLGDVAVLMLTLPDWFAGLVASGALAYVLVPAWAGLDAAQVAASQRRLTGWLLGLGVALAFLAWLARVPAVALLAGGISPMLRPAAAQALAWSAAALPAALIAALWTTRLQHERDFTGIYAANLVVNACLIAAIVAAGRVAGTAGGAGPAALDWLGAGLLLAMLARLAWLRWRAAPVGPGEQAVLAPPLPGPGRWLLAGLAAGLPLALPFVARSVASQGGEGALAVFNYAWKLVELPLILAIQLVGTIAFPHVARAVAASDDIATRDALRKSFALAWVMACAAAAGLLVAAPAVARLLFGWGRMDAVALATVAEWGRIGAWGLLPQALAAVSLTLLAARGRLRPVVVAYALALAALLAAGGAGWVGGAALMWLVDGLLAVVALVLVAAMGPLGRSALPLGGMAAAFLSLAGVAALAAFLPGAVVAPVPDGPAEPAFVVASNIAASLVAALVAAALVLGASWFASRDLRAALAR